MGEDVIAFAAGEGEGELGEEEAVRCADVVTTTGDREGEIALAGGERVEGGRKAEWSVGVGGAVFFEDGKNFRTENVEAEETQIETRAKTRDDQLLLRDRGSGFFENGFNLVNGLFAADEPAADRAVGSDLTFASGLDGRDGAIFGSCDVEELAGAAFLTLGNVKMITDEMKKRFVADKLAAAQNGVTVTARFRLNDETHARA